MSSLNKKYIYRSDAKYDSCDIALPISSDDGIENELNFIYDAGKNDEVSGNKSSIKEPVIYEDDEIRIFTFNDDTKNINVIYKSNTTEDNSVVFENGDNEHSNIFTTISNKYTAINTKVNELINKINNTGIIDFEESVYGSANDVTISTTTSMTCNGNGEYTCVGDINRNSILLIEKSKVGSLPLFVKIIYNDGSTDIPVYDIIHDGDYAYDKYKMFTTLSEKDSYYIYIPGFSVHSDKIKNITFFNKNGDGVNLDNIYLLNQTDKWVDI